MCITEEKKWVYGGKSYDSEIEAVKAALTGIGQQFIKEFHNRPLEGLLELGEDISDLRLRYYALTSPAPVDSTGISEKFAGEPKVRVNDDRRGPLSLTDMTRRYMDIPRHSPAYKAVLQWLDREGYTTFEAAAQSVRGAKRKELSNLIGIAK